MSKRTRFPKALLAYILAAMIFLLPFNIVVSGVDEATPSEGKKSKLTVGEALSGNGSQENPYIISSSDDWDALSNHINNGGTYYNGKHFKLTKDISVSTVLGNRPDTSTDSNDNVFSGVFDGDNHTLDVNIDDPVFMFVWH